MGLAIRLRGLSVGGDLCCDAASDVGHDVVRVGDCAGPRPVRLTSMNSRVDGRRCDHLPGA